MHLGENIKSTTSWKGDEEEEELVGHINPSIKNLREEQKGSPIQMGRHQLRGNIPSKFMNLHTRHSLQDNWLYAKICFTSCILQPSLEKRISKTSLSFNTMIWVEKRKLRTVSPILTSLTNQTKTKQCNIKVEK